ncbi:hypothetical protein [Saccharopolyspora elongata]|nr:hypothetical protein [Saccharopolyspora elongata]
MKVDELFSGDLVEGVPSAAEAIGTKAPGPEDGNAKGDYCN